MGVRASVAWQPIVGVTGAHEAVADEALARFDDGRSPAEWFASASARRVEDELQALLLQAALAAPPAGDRLLALNVSAHLLEAPRVAAVLRDADLGRVVLELGERELAGVGGDAARSLRAAGARLALDDTGQGYGGLASIAALRPDWVKVDRGLVGACDTDPVARASVGMYLRVARRVGAATVAEGVEREAQLAVLAELGVDLAQGWLLGRPVAALGGVRVPDHLVPRERASA